jgi:hypothetical protein
LVFGRRFFGGWFSEFGHAKIFFSVVSLPVAFIPRSDKRRKNGMSRVRVLF